MPSTPKWAMDLVIGIEEWEDLHPASCACGAVQNRALCLEKLRDQVPPDVLRDARAIRHYQQQADQQQADRSAPVKACSGPHICLYKRQVDYCRESCLFCSGDSVRPCLAHRDAPAT